MASKAPKGFWARFSQMMSNAPLNVQLFILIILIVVIMTAIIIVSSLQPNSSGTPANPYFESFGYQGKGYYNMENQTIYVANQSQFYEILQTQVNATLGPPPTTSIQVPPSPFLTVTGWDLNANDFNTVTLQLNVSYNANYTYNVSLLAPNGKFLNYTLRAQAPNSLFYYLSQADQGLATPLSGTYLFNASYQGTTLFQKSFTFNGPNVNVLGYTYGMHDSKVRVFPSNKTYGNYTYPGPFWVLLYNSGDMPVYVNRSSSYISTVIGTHIHANLTLSPNALWLMPQTCVEQNASEGPEQAPGTYALHLSLFDASGSSITAYTNYFVVPIPATYHGC